MATQMDTQMDSQMEDPVLNKISQLSRNLPPYLIEHYETILASFSISPDNPLQPISLKFFNLFSKLASKEDSKHRAVTYTYYILKDLGWNEADLRAFLVKDLSLNQQIKSELSQLKVTSLKAIHDLTSLLDLQLGEFQCSRYRLALSVLTKATYSPKNTFLEMYEIIKNKLGGEPLALAYTRAVLKRSNWGNINELTRYACPNFSLERKPYQKIDLCLIVADYFCNMTEPDYRSTKVLLATAYLNGRNVSNISMIDFVLHLINSEVVEPGKVSKIENKRRYPVFFKEYMKKFEEAKKTDQVSPPQIMVIPQMETVGPPTNTTTELSSTEGISTPVSCTDTEEDETDGGPFNGPLTGRTNNSIKLATPTSNVTTPSLSSTGAVVTNPTTVQSDRGAFTTSTTTSTRSTEFQYQITAHSEKGEGDDVVGIRRNTLDSRPVLPDALRLLLPLAFRWELIGMCLNLKPEQRPDPSTNLPIEMCLGKVLEEWMRSCDSSKVTWRTLINVLENILHADEIVVKIKEFLDT